MKARVKATGEIVEVIPRALTSRTGGEILKYINTENGVSYFDYELYNIGEKEDNTPDYWDKLLHQYAGMAMQGMLSSNMSADDIAYFAVKYATALVERLKNE